METVGDATSLTAAVAAPSDAASELADGSAAEPVIVGTAPEAIGASGDTESTQERDAREKRRDLLLRSAAALKDLLQSLRAPGKKD